jgi:mannosyl-3-phosphoglycerate phosphatase family protein
MKKQLIIFTDLDGTLLDALTYSFKPAAEALALIDKYRIPLIICSSKTRTEIEYYRLLLKNNHPFVSENGGGIFIPREYTKLENHIDKTTGKFDNYHMIRLGTSYRELRQGIKSLRAKGFDIKGFGDMTVYEISHVTGLSAEEASMARQREFDEPFLFGGADERLNALFESIHELGFSFTQGNFFHLLGNNDKGKAVSILIELYAKQFKDLCTVAIGDSPNDLPMLRNVDMPVVVRKQTGAYDSSLVFPKLICADGTGPEGWNKAIIQVIKQRFQ